MASRIRRIRRAGVERRGSMMIRTSPASPMILVAGLLLAGPLRGNDESPQEITPSPASALLKQANALKEEQLEVAGQLVKSLPDSIDALVLMGYAYSSHGMLAETQKCWESCLRLDPGRADIYAMMGQVALQREDHEKAVEFCRKAASLAPAMPGVHFRLARGLMASGKTEDAIAALGKDLEISPRSNESHYLLGQAYLQLKEYEQAKASYRAALSGGALSGGAISGGALSGGGAEIQPSHTNACYGLAMVCGRLGQREESAKYREMFRRLKAKDIKANRDTRSQYDDLDRMRHKLAVTCTDAGRLYRRHGYLWKAEKLWQRAATLDGGNVECRKLLAVLYEQGKRSKEAVGMYRQLIEIEPEDQGYHQKVGLLSAGLKRFDDAEKAFKKMIELRPKQGEGYRMLAQLFLNLNRNLPEAKLHAATALRLEPIAPSYYVMAWAHAKNRQRTAALSAIRRAVQLEPGSAKYRQMYESIQKGK